MTTHRLYLNKVKKKEKRKKKAITQADDAASSAAAIIYFHFVSGWEKKSQDNYENRKRNIFIVYTPMMAKSTRVKEEKPEMKTI